MENYNDNLHKNASPVLYSYAKEMRKVPTATEELLWQQLRNRKVSGLKFRRQHPLYKYIADFYSHEKKLVIELDGGIHENREQREADERRTRELNDLGVTVLRFRNEEIVNDIEAVKQKIAEVVSKLPDCSG